MPLAVLALWEARAWSRRPGGPGTVRLPRWLYAAAETEPVAAARALLAAEGAEVVTVADRPSAYPSSSAASASTPVGNSDPVAVTVSGSPSTICANETT